MKSKLYENGRCFSVATIQVTGDVCLIAVNGQSLPKMRDLFRRNMLVEKEFMFHTLEEYASCHDVVIEHTKHLKVYILL